jgi:hypothetical protein
MTLLKSELDAYIAYLVSLSDVSINTMLHHFFHKKWMGLITDLK